MGTAGSIDLFSFQPILYSEHKSINIGIHVCKLSLRTHPGLTKGVGSENAPCSNCVLPILCAWSRHVIKQQCSWLSKRGALTLHFDSLHEKSPPEPTPLQNHAPGNRGERAAFGAT